MELSMRKSRRRDISFRLQGKTQTDCIAPAKSEPVPRHGTGKKQSLPVLSPSSGLSARIPVLSSFLVPRSEFRPCRVKTETFTLIELLIVIAIIAILASMLLPALSVARKKAYSINCIGNLRQQGVSFMLYNDNYDGYFPIYGMKRDAKDITWINLLLENGGITVKSIVDPGLKAVIAQDKTYGGYSYSGYGYNFRYVGSYAGRGIPSANVDSTRSAKLQEFKRPSEGYLVMDAAKNNGRYDTGNYRVIEYPGSSSGNGTIDAVRHDGTVNVLYLDGHAVGVRVQSRLNPYATLGTNNTINWTGGRRGIEVNGIMY